MFDFLGMDMLDNYEQRKVDRYEVGELKIDTARVSDSTQPYETAVAHPDYNHGEWVIVEQYDDVESAKIGHTRWVKAMTGELPDELMDVSEAGIAQLGDVLHSGNDWRRFKREKK